MDYNAIRLLNPGPGKLALMRVQTFIFAIGIFALVAAAVPATPVRSATTNAPSAPVDDPIYAETPTDPAPQSQASSTNTIVLPILVYHIVRPSQPSDSAAVRAVALTPETFDAELAHLKSAGYHVVGFHDLEMYFASSTPLPSKPIILSFDDGWLHQFTYAFPILEKYRDTATFFVYTDAIDHKGFMSWQDLKTLIAAGMTIGDHSRSHPYLTRITNPQRLWDEIHGSKEVLEKELGVPVTEFAYPYGQYNPAIIALLQKAGFLSARGDVWSGNIQSADRLYELSAINAPTTIAKFVKDFP